MRIDENGNSVLSSSDEQFITDLLQAYQAGSYAGLIDRVKTFELTDLRLVEQGVWRELSDRIILHDASEADDTNFTTGRLDFATLFLNLGR